MSERLKVRNWDRWQSYRTDRGQPPWIKIHRCVMRNPEWVTLSDAERGQLVSIWLLAADSNGEIPDDPRLLQKLCFMDKPPNIEKFINLGFLCGNGVNVASTWRQHDPLETEESRDRVETDSLELKKDSASKPVVSVPLIPKDGYHPISNEQIQSWQKDYPGIDVHQELVKLKNWNQANPKKRKTKSGIQRHIASWLAKAQDGAGRRKEEPIHPTVVPKPFERKYGDE